MGRMENIERLRQEIGGIAAGTAGQGGRQGPNIQPLPFRGLPSHSVHEIEGAAWDCETGAAAAGFAAILLSRFTSGPIVWVVRGEDTPFPPRLASFGLDPDRLIFCRCRNNTEALAAVEEALRAPGIAAALGEIGDVTLTQSRRLHLICERIGSTGFLLRRQFHGAPSSIRKAQGSAATTRWRIQFAPTQTGEPGLGAPRWRLDLLYCRGGMPASYLVEWSDETGDLRLVAKLADHEALAQHAGLRRVG
jgi:protein ImuA